MVIADSTVIVPHQDPIDIDATLSLSKLIDLTLAKYPDTVWLTSLEDSAT